MITIDQVWEVKLFVPGLPAAQGSKRHVGGGRLVEQSKAVGPWRTVIAWHMARVWKQALLGGPVTVALDFVMPRPKATPKRFTPAAVKRPDIDKLERAVFDALTGIVWKDDSQVIRVLASKRIAELGEVSGVLIRIGTEEW